MILFLVYIELFHPPPQRGAAHLELPGAVVVLPAGLIEGLEYYLSFKRLQRLGLVKRFTDEVPVLKVLRQVLGI